MKIISFDPGGTTGYALAIFDEKASTGITRVELNQLEIVEHHLLLWQLLEKEQPDLVLCESFEYRVQSRAGLVLVSKEYIGICKVWCKINGKSYREQSPSVAKGFVSDANIKNLDWYRPSFRHSMDAVRHLIYFIVNSNTGAMELSKAKKYVLENGYRA